MSKSSPDLPPELGELAERLTDERPALDPLAYDRGQQRVRRASSRSRRSRRPSLAIALCLSLGAILSSGGAGLAVSGLSSTGSTAVQAQYPTTPTSNYTATTPTQSVAGTTTSGYTTPTKTAATTTTETIGTVPTTAAETSPTVAGVTATSPTQAAAQVGAEQGAGSLPFTGFAAIPVMLAGLALLLTGLALRRRRATTDQ